MVRSSLTNQFSENIIVMLTFFVALLESVVDVLAPPALVSAPLVDELSLLVSTVAPRPLLPRIKTIFDGIPYILELVHKQSCFWCLS